MARRKKYPSVPRDERFWQKRTCCGRLMQLFPDPNDPTKPGYLRCRICGNVRTFTDNQFYANGGEGGILT